VTWNASPDRKKSLINHPTPRVNAAIGWSDGGFNAVKMEKSFEKLRKQGVLSTLV
jgi:hypothetical protein